MLILRDCNGYEQHMTIVDGRNKSCITLLINMPALTNVMKTAYKTVENCEESRESPWTSKRAR